MVLVSLLAAGVGLAIDAYEERQLARDQRRNANAQEQIAPLENGIVPANSNNGQRELEAFNELQSYADFSSALSQKVLDDIAQEDASANYGSRSFSPYSIESSYSHQSYDKSATSPFNSSGLATPLVFPQNRIENGSGHWPRAYAPALMSCGIDQKVFLNFIDSFNDSLGVSPQLAVVNVAQLSSFSSWQNDIAPLSTAIPAAVRLAKSASRDPYTESFLDQANDILFRARGLYAMVVALLPDTPAQVTSVDSSAHRGGMFAAVNNTYSPRQESKLQRVSNFVTDRQDSKLQRVSNFVADYTDRWPPLHGAPNSNLPSFDRFSSAPSSPNGSRVGVNSGILSSSPFSLPIRDSGIDIHKRRRRRENGTRPGLRTGLLRDVVGGRLSRGAKVNKDTPNSTSRQFDESTAIPSGFSGQQLEAGVLYLVIVNDVPDQPATVSTMWKGKEPATSNFGAATTWNNNTVDSMRRKLPLQDYHMETDQTAPPAYTPGRSYGQ